MNEDLIGLLLYLARQQVKTVDTRGDTLIHILETGSETITPSDTLVSITLSDHPIKWGEPKWSLATWG